MSRRALRIVALVVLAVAILVAIVIRPDVSRVANIPVHALFSTGRMFAAFLLSLLFAISYGTIAGTNKHAEEVLIPVLDILQSVPILAFFPIVFLVLVGPGQSSVAGAELAVVILIFTSMSWNMAFGVYEAIKTIPTDLVEAVGVYGVKDWLRFRRLFLPASIPKLVYNSMLSWTVGWFYLVASEVFTTGSTIIKRPGLGSDIYNAGISGDTGTIALGLAALVVVIVALDTFMWRPLSVWAERFKLDVVASGLGTRPAPAYIRLSWLPRFTGFRRFLAGLIAPLLHGYDKVRVRIEQFYRRHRRALRILARIDLAMFVAVLIIGLGIGVLDVIKILSGPLPAETSQIPAFALLSLGRLVLAYGAAIAWTIPAAVWLARSQRASRFVTPIVEVVGSIPATALLPLIIGFAVFVTTGLRVRSELSAFIIALFAMQWYLLFNLIAAVRGIPGDLEEAARTFGLRGWDYWKRLIFPAMIPSLLTGSITAWGAGWNSLIVAEYLEFGDTTFTVPGIGFLIYKAVWITKDYALLLLSVLALIAVVVTLNKLLWRPLIRRASERFRYEL
jgi:NitT/TauT family transport system permease protein